MKRIVLPVVIASMCFGCSARDNSSVPTSIETQTEVSTSNENESVTADPVKFRADVWADNWFALYVNGKKVGEDSVPITTERSFNSERITFEATYPLTIAVVVKDYVENSSGLEYIGTDRQQIGDGGFIAQIVDVSSDSTVAVTDGSWKSLVVQSAPLNPECVASADPLNDCRSREGVIPVGWETAQFDDGTWAAATEFDASEVGPKDGYNDIKWDSAGRFIWGADLKADNVVLLRLGGVQASPKL